MRDFDFANFYKNIQDDLLEARKLVGSIAAVELNEMYYGGGEDVYDEEKEFNKERLIDILNSIFLKIHFAYEYIGLPRMSDKLSAELSKYENKFSELEYISYVDVLYSPVESILRKHIDAMTAHVEIEKNDKNEGIEAKLLLEQILRGIPKMLSDREIEPTNEAVVRKEVYQTLIHVFPDTIKEIPIAKVSKTYKPDIGIKSLKSAVEYKFVDSAEEAKTVIGGVFEDIQGYAGSEDWKTFYAVIYMTDNYLTIDQVHAEFKLSEVPHNWKPIVIFGKGKRKKNLRVAKDVPFK